MRYPLLRSPLLWGALFVMAFTVWAWVDSRGMESFLRWPSFTVGSGHRGVSVVAWGAPVADPGVTMHRVKTEHPFPGEVIPPPFFLRGSGPDPEEAAAEELPEGVEDFTKPEDPPSFKEFMVITMSERTPQNWCVFVPYWLIMVGTALVAGALIVWRARRWKRMALVPEVEIREGERA